MYEPHSHYCLASYFVGLFGGCQYIMIEAMLIAYCLIAFLLWLVFLGKASIEDCRHTDGNSVGRVIEMVFYIGLLPVFLLWPLLLIGVLLS